MVSDWAVEQVDKGHRGYNSTCGIELAGLQYRLGIGGDILLGRPMSTGCFFLVCKIVVQCRASAPVVASVPIWQEFWQHASRAEGLSV